MKKLIFLTILVFAALFAAPPFALANSVSMDDILKEIQQAQGIEKNFDIQCDKITDEQFEKLGDAAMDIMHPNENQHELMDQMMGGEGSNSLRAMHIMMGRNYLGCWDGALGTGGGLMGGGMMGGGMMGSYWNPTQTSWQSGAGSMMGWGAGTGWAWFGWIFMVLFWLLIVVAIIALIKWLVEQSKKEKK